MFTWWSKARKQSHIIMGNYNYYGVLTVLTSRNLIHGNLCVFSILDDCIREKLLTYTCIRRNEDWNGMNKILFLAWVIIAFLISENTHNYIVPRNLYRHLPKVNFQIYFLLHSYMSTFFKEISWNLAIMF